jgi:ABC-type multidrug transport system fused ATPase/permease subunit
MIARALYEDPEIIVLDEATAALDNITEREVTQAILNLSGKKTIICVAHRLSTIKNSSRIYFMKGHRICAKGTFDQLLVRSPEFADMVAAGEGKLLTAKNMTGDDAATVLEQS